jgi:hypothetical protein
MVVNSETNSRIVKGMTRVGSFILVFIVNWAVDWEWRACCIYCVLGSGLKQLGLSTLEAQVPNQWQNLEAVSHFREHTAERSDLSFLSLSPLHYWHIVLDTFGDDACLHVASKTSTLPAASYENQKCLQTFSQNLRGKTITPSENQQWRWRDKKTRDWVFVFLKFTEGNITKIEILNFGAQFMVRCMLSHITNKEVGYHWYFLILYL